MKAIIYSVGTEILLGSILDTNSKFIADRLQSLGINLYKMETLGDNFERLYEGLKEADGKYDYVFVTGGLGPTDDDISKEVAVKVCGLEDEMVLDEKSYQSLKEYFNDSKRAMTVNKKQAIFPKSAIILKNDQGTAPGCIIEGKSKFILMPGPPNEMTYMFDHEVIPHIKTDMLIKSVNCKIGLLGEWDVASRIDLSGSNPTISPYAKKSGVELRVTASAKTQADLEKRLEDGVGKVKETFGNLLVTTEDITREEILINELRKRSEFVSTAESITGGLIASSIIDISGASDVLKESYVTYANETKHKILDVSYETIDKYDVVSPEVVGEMLDGLYKRTGADLTIATSGYAHQGLAYLGVLYKGKKYIRKINVKGERNKVRRVAKNKIIDMSILIVRGVYEDYINI